MPTGEHLDHEHQAMAGRARWRNLSQRERARMMRAQAEGLLRRALVLDPQGDTFTAEPDQGPVTE